MSEHAQNADEQLRSMVEIIEDLINSDSPAKLLVDTDTNDVSRPLIEAIFWFIKDPAQAVNLAKKLILKRDGEGMPLSATAAEVGITFEYDTSAPTERDINRLIMAIHQKAMRERAQVEQATLSAPAKLSNSISSGTLIFQQKNALEGSARMILGAIERGEEEMEVPTKDGLQTKPVVEAIIYKIKNPELQAVLVAVYLAYKELEFLEFLRSIPSAITDRALTASPDLGDPTSPFPEIGASVGIALPERPNQNDVKQFIAQLQTKVGVENANIIIESRPPARPPAPNLSPPPVVKQADDEGIELTSAGEFDEQLTDPDIDLEALAAGGIELAPGASPQAKALLALIESDGIGSDAYTAAIEGEQIICSVIEGIFWEKFAKRISPETANLLARHCMSKMGQAAYRRKSPHFG